MMGPIQVVFFDLGNTLFYDSATKWPKTYAMAEAALWESLRHHGAKAPPETVYGRADTLLGYYYALRGDGLREPGTFHVLRELLRPHSPEIADAQITVALRAMYKVTQTNWRKERDAASVLRTVRRAGFRIGAISNGSDDWNALELLNKAGLREYFDMVLTSAAHGSRKPDPSIFRTALQHFRVDAEDAVMIGDSYEADILGAAGVGMHTIWITARGAQGIRAATIQPGARVQRLREIPPLLR